jgi:hypothetical protein
MSYIKLDGHWINHIPGCVQVATASVTMPLPGGLTVEMAGPFVPLGNDLAITPVFEADGEHAVRMRLDLWHPMHLNPVIRFPLSLKGQEIAVRIARDFDADPATRWDCTADEAMAWCLAWEAANTPATGEGH